MMLQNLNRLSYKLLRSLPVFRDILLVVNAYAWTGDARFVREFASFGTYFKRIFSKIFICVALALLTLFAAKKSHCDLGGIDVPSLNLGLFPNLLGFGIGVYALIFIFPKDLLTRLDKNQKQGNRRVGAQGLNTAIAYPLAVFLLILLSSLLLRFIKPSNMTVTFGIFLAFYGLVMCLELITFMLMAARRLITNSLKNEDQETGI